MHPARLKKPARIALKAAAWLLSLVALAFFAARIARSDLPPGWYRDTGLIATTLITSVLYAGGVGMLAVAWNLLLPAPLNKRDIANYLISQFGKYVPGNVLQFAGRHLLGRQAGHLHGPLAAAAVFEIISLIGVSCGLLLLVGQPTLQKLLPWWRPLPAAVGLVPLLLLPACQTMLMALRWRRWPQAIAPLRALTAAALHLGFFALFASAFLLLCRATGEVGVRLLEATGGIATGWLGGFIIPGAPAGVGLREAIIMMSVPDASPHSSSLLLAIAVLRLVTLGGDFIAYLGGLIMRR